MIVNPLYRIEAQGTRSVLTLTFPTDEYAEEFAAAKRYLPETLTVPGDLTRAIDIGLIGRDRYEDLCRRLVFISAPEHYI
jgi:hypothetical protein